MTEKKETASQRKRRAKQKTKSARPVASTSSGEQSRAPRKRRRRPKKNASSHNAQKNTQHATDSSTKNGKQVQSKSGSNKKGSKKKRGGKKRFGRRDTLQTNAERVLSVTSRDDRNAKKLPKLAKGTLRVIPIGGNEEVGRNMNIIEYENDIVIIDMGMQFPEEDMPGIDYIVPNANYLKGKEKNIRGVIFTHGHLDHIGAAPILLKQLGYPPVIARDLTLALIKKKVEDGNPGAANNLKTVSIKDLDRAVRLGQFRANFFDVEHSIMDSMGVALESPAGTVMHLGDWMISHDPLEGEKTSYAALEKFPQPIILMLESLCAVNKGEPKSEREVQENLQKLIADAPGRVIVGTFASQVKRVSDLLHYIEKQGKKVAFDGYSMRTNMEIAQELGYIKVQKGTIIPINEINKYPDNKVVVICTGAQGEHNAVLNRIVTDNHRVIKLKKSDTILFSSSVVPGNERSVQRLKDNLYRKCDNVVHSEVMNIHIGGHSTLEDLQTVVKQVKPKYFLPVYANHYMLKEAVNAAVRTGFPREDAFVMENGNIIEFAKNKKPQMLKDKADSSYVFVDGLGVGDVGHMVLRDRQVLSADGMYVITALLDSKTKRIVGNIQITSRGFIVVKDNFELVNETKRKVEKIIKDSTSKDTKLDWKFVENNIRDRVGEFLFQKTQRRPMVLPVVIEV